MVLAELLADLSNAPDLRGAACAGRADIFDRAAESKAAVPAALAICGHCEVLARCEQWALGLPYWDRPRGVVGGRARGRKPITADAANQSR